MLQGHLVPVCGSFSMELFPYCIMGVIIPVPSIPWDNVTGAWQKHSTENSSFRASLFCLTSPSSGSQESSRRLSPGSRSREVSSPYDCSEISLEFELPSEFLQSAPRPPSLDGWFLTEPIYLAYLCTSSLPAGHRPYPECLPGRSVTQATPHS